MSKIRVGIFMGGVSREREVSFAGGRTIYDNLNKSVFEPVPVFVDSYGNFCLLEWQYIYKGTIRDFFPPTDWIPPGASFQYYVEYLGLSTDKQKEVLSCIGTPVHPEEFRKYFDVAFLCLHGEGGEDGTIQGLLEYYQIPYTGSGIWPSAFGLNKSIQKKWMQMKGFLVPRQKIFSREQTLREMNFSVWLEEIKNHCGLPFVIKPANQGSSVGVSVLKDNDAEALRRAVFKSLFIRQIWKDKWQSASSNEKKSLLLEWSDIRNGVAFPAFIRCGNSFVVAENPDSCQQILDRWEFAEDAVLLEGIMSEKEWIAEEFLDGREFSCIVLEDGSGNPVALPPTEIIKGDSFFDYRSKYLPGLSRKITPINLEPGEIHRIRRECERLYKEFHFDVYARIDGFYLSDGRIFLNDPNTTSGMMPSSFFFHQAAEIGLNPSELLTCIIFRSLQKQCGEHPGRIQYKNIFYSLKNRLHQLKKNPQQKRKVAVIMGGYSSERHISVESGRNVFEKLASSEKYEAFPVFLTGGPFQHRLFLIPLPLLLKDNADDIRDAILDYRKNTAVQKILEEAVQITSEFSTPGSLKAPREITYDQLRDMCDMVFIALHGSPGENGEVQAELEKRSIPYNGSGAKSSSITIHKYHTNEILKKHGIRVAEHMLISKNQWQENKDMVLENIEHLFRYPFIAKPPDDGCSSAVKKIHHRRELEHYLMAAFRDTQEIRENILKILRLKPNEEFPPKNEVLIEELITSNGADHFLEITGGMLTHFNQKGERIYEVFEPSEAVATGDVLSLEEKFLAGEGQNITPARFAKAPAVRQKISNQVKKILQKTAEILNVEGYCRIDAFVRVFGETAEVIIIEINSLPGMTPATCIFHQAAIQNYRPADFIDKILEYGWQRNLLRISTQ